VIISDAASYEQNRFNLDQILKNVLQTVKKYVFSEPTSNFYEKKVKIKK
jgi:hypothetical protein